MHMADWGGKLDAFLQFNERNILTHVGQISQNMAEEHAHIEFDKHQAERRRIEATTPSSDFDTFVEETKKLDHEDSDTAKARKQAGQEKKGTGE
jgi:hypothetical protein